MNKLFIGLITAFSMSFGVSAFADNAKDCEKLKDEYNLIYAAKGFCFKDADAKAKFGNENCNTTKPKFSEKEQQKLDSIKARQKELNCK
ncbi:YARHG domain-containing protein [Acinetobacter shaoyimingii]|uniref:YARHG domain-containing protein n=1 Tax=Acinetobacter shaoyimingii TaxID=2715164 RepID=A0A6G8RV16_9GAMM|nr:YARHG domain-containing protein [Acinetobacter shaoyimingii]QIO05764.1 YARHG domain-containing protein [Acinetobacter shaoyimingii]